MTDAIQKFIGRQFRLDTALDVTVVLGYIAFYFYSAHKQERDEKGPSGQFLKEPQIISGSHA